jgi:hypothetical protein
LEPAVLDYGAEPGFAKELASLVNMANTKECPILGCEIKDAGCVTNTGDAKRHVKMGYSNPYLVKAKSTFVKEGWKVTFCLACHNKA